MQELDCSDFITDTGLANIAFLPVNGCRNITNDGLKRCISNTTSVLCF